MTLSDGSMHRLLVSWWSQETQRLQLLGNLSDAQPEIGSLALGANYDTTHRSLLWYFHLKLKINPAAKGVKDFYLTLPVKSLNVEVIEYRPPAQHDRIVEEAQKAGIEQCAQYIRLLFSLKELSSVAMPTETLGTKQMTHKCRGLLQSLRSLSKVEIFTVIFPYNNNYLTLLNDYSTALKTGLQTSPIDFSQAYRGRPWGFNQWEAYNLDEEAATPSWNPCVDDFPPSYEDAVNSTHPLQNSTADQNLKVGVAEDPVDSTMSASSASINKNNNNTTESLDGEHDIERGHYQKRNLEEASSDVESSCQEKNTTVDQHPQPKEQPVGSEEHPSPSAETRRSSSGSQPNPSSLIDEGTNWQLFTDAVGWLTTALCEQRDAIEAFLPELKKLAQAARENDKERYTLVRVESMFLLFTRKRISGSPGLLDDDSPIDDLLLRFNDFLYRTIAPNADVSIIKELYGLNEVAMKWKQADRGNMDDWLHWKRQFAEKMAFCLLSAVIKDKRDWLDKGKKK